MSLIKRSWSRTAFYSMLAVIDILLIISQNKNDLFRKDASKFNISVKFCVFIKSCIITIILQLPKIYLHARKRIKIL